MHISVWKPQWWIIWHLEEKNEKKILNLVMWTMFKCIFSNKKRFWMMSIQVTERCLYSNQTIPISLRGIKKASFSVRASFDNYKSGNLLTFFWWNYRTGPLWLHRVWKEILTGCFGLLSFWKRMIAAAGTWEGTLTGYSMWYGCNIHGVFC